MYLLPSLDAEPEPLAITVSTAVPGRRRRLLDPTEHLTAVQPDHGADTSLVQWRGKAFHLTHRECPARAVAADSSVRVRESAVLGQTGSVVVVTDVAGEDSVEVHSLAGGETRTLVSGGLGRVLHLAADRQGSAVAVISHDGRISRITVEDG